MKKLVGVLAVLLFVVFWTIPHDFFESSAAKIQTATSTSLIDKQKYKTIPKNPNLLSIPDHNSESNIKVQPIPSDVLERSSCTTHQQLNSDVDQQAVYQWIEDSVGIDIATLANIYAYSSEADLLQAAKNGDSTAMLALGINYKWHAIHENFQADRLRPKDQPDVVYTVKPLDKNIMKKARYWLMQAALNNQLIGLSELAFSYIDEKNQSENIKEKQTLELNFLAYFSLVDYMQPSSEKTMPANLFYVDDKEKQESLENKREELVTQWRKDRLKMGQNENLELNPSKEVMQYLKLQRTLCRDTKRAHS